MDTREVLRQQFLAYGLTHADALATVLANDDTAHRHVSEICAVAHAVSLSGTSGRFQDVAWDVRPVASDLPLEVSLRWEGHALVFDAPGRATSAALDTAYLRRLADPSDPVARTSVAQRLEQLRHDERLGLFDALARGVAEARERQLDADRLESVPPWQAWLIGAARAGHEPALRACLGMGAEPDAPDLNGNAALHHAARFGHAHLVAPLADAGAHLDLANRHGRTPLQVAADHGRAPVCLALMAHGATPDHAHTHRHEHARGLAQGL